MIKNVNVGSVSTTRRFICPNSQYTPFLSKFSKFAFTLSDTTSKLIALLEFIGKNLPEKLDVNQCIFIRSINYTYTYSLSSRQSLQILCISVRSHYTLSDSLPCPAEELKSEAKLTSAVVSMASGQGPRNGRFESFLNLGQCISKK